MKTLLLNADYTPYDLISWKKAFGLIWQEDSPVICLAHSEKCKIDSKGRKHQIPSVLLLKAYYNNNRPASYSKGAVYARDGMKCQYCRIACDNKTISIDHIMPRSRWNKANGKVSSFENVVTCCKRCNKRKGDNTPEEAKMRLIRKPRRVTRPQLIAYKAKLLGMCPHWSQYLESYTTNDQSPT